FRLSQAPLIILDGFFMMVASLWTIWYLTGRFQSVMESIRRSVDTIHRADVARSSAAMAAFVLGISNMRKRKIRTFLTAATLILLTFTILSFTSFETMPAQMLRRTSSDPASYVGVLVRRMSWDRIGEMMGRDLSNFFRAQDVPVAMRSWFVSREQTQELKLDVRRVDPAQSASSAGSRPTGAWSAGPVVVANAMLGLSPEEHRFSGLGTGEYLQRGKWFSGREYDWPFVCVLPGGMFENLAIELDKVAGDVDYGEAQDPRPTGAWSADATAAYVSVLGRRLRVVGVLDSQKLAEYKDLDRETLTPVDFQEQQYMESGGGGGLSLTATGGQTAEDFVSAPDSDEEEVPYVHMDPDRVLIVPHDLCMKLGGTLRAIVAGPGRPASNPSGSPADSPSEAGLLETTGPGAAAGMIAPLYDGTPSAGWTGAGGSRAARPAASFERIVRDFVARVTLPLYEGTEGGKVARLATRGRLSVGGLKGLVVPVLIAALIVFNTMLGAVYERVTEIKVYAAVGLAPIHIASLFFAESCVFAVVGTMCGYLLGQVVSFGLMHVPWLMAGISLNYSSVSAVWSALLVIAIVIASTAYPARMAGKLSVPDETRKMIIQRPTSDIWEIRFPFTVSSKEALGVMGYLRDYFVTNNEDSVGAFTADNITYY
ncbi:MAG: ABC transporter permease, partial [Candidatus Brocadiia bacterium]|nr:ABC transporter permease [Candidatus Brocadiia bacterium]